MLTCFRLGNTWKSIIYHVTGRQKDFKVIEILYRNIGGEIQPPLKLVKRGYADLFPTRKHMKINNPRFLRPPERL